jgi:hypothetical protein
LSSPADARKSSCQSSATFQIGPTLMRFGALAAPEGQLSFLGFCKEPEICAPWAPRPPTQQKERYSSTGTIVQPAIVTRIEPLRRAAS